MKKEFVCICGRIFDNPQSFNGHKGHCKEHQLDKYGNLDVYNKNRERTLNNQAKGIETLSKRAKENKDAKIEQWRAENHTCEHCGKLMTVKFGSGRFCSRVCANSRIQTDIQNAKRSEKLKGIEYYSNGETTIGVKPNEKAPEGFIKGNFSISKLSFDGFKNKNRCKTVMQSKRYIDQIECKY